MKRGIVSAAAGALLALAWPLAASGQYLFSEAHIGVAVQDGQADEQPAFGTRVQFGAGGRVGGSPVRLFGFGSVGVSHGSGSATGALLSTELERTWVDYGVGLRLLIPFSKNVRIYGDLQLGYAHVLSDVSIGQWEQYAAEMNDFAVVLAAGLQYRMARWASVALRTEWTSVVWSDAFDAAGAIAGLDARPGSSWDRFGFYATVGFHF